MDVELRDELLVVQFPKLFMFSFMPINIAVEQAD